MSKWRVALLSIAYGAMLGVSAAAHAASSVKVNWAVPTTREDGKALTAGELTGYEIYYTTDTNTSATIQVSGGSSTSYTVPNLAAGTYHFAISAVDTKGLKSKLSSVADVTLAASSAVPNAVTAITTSISSTASGKSIVVNWTPPKTRTDGSALAATDLSGYAINLYSSGTAVVKSTLNGGSTSTYSIANMKAGYYFVELIAIDRDGRKSASAYQLVVVP